jgi:hydrogenase small subunit
VLPMLTGLTTVRAISRRSFVKRTCVMAAAAVGLPSTAAAEIFRAVQAGMKPSVIWLHFSECTGCTESLLRTTQPTVDSLILDLISLDYHETLMAAAGHQAEAARYAAMEAHRGNYVLIIEGAIPTAEDGIYCMVGGHTAMEMTRECAEHAGAIIAIGSCASWGGIPSAAPNPTGCTGAPQILTDKTVVSLPGCPPNPYNLLGTVLQYATFGTLPELDDVGRPVFAYGRTIHEDCPRRPHFDAGRFAVEFGDEGHRKGHCLYKLGCKGPQTYANCSLQSFCEVPGAWPVGLGAPCFGCTMPGIGFSVAMHDTLPIAATTPPSTHPAIHTPQGLVSPMATGVAGVVAGGLIGAGIMVARRLGDEPPAPAALKGTPVPPSPATPPEAGPTDKPFIPVDRIEPKREQAREEV